MNIFRLHNSPELAAKYHCDKHVVKMVTEYAQILSTVARQHIPDIPPYSGSMADRPVFNACYQKHPLVLWVSEGRENWRYVLSLGLWTAQEYTYRYGKIHASSRILDTMADMYYVYMRGILPEGRTPQHCSVDARFRMFDPVTAYRLCYFHTKSRMHKWTKRPVPPWILDHVGGKADMF